MNLKTLNHSSPCWGCKKDMWFVYWHGDGLQVMFGGYSSFVVVMSHSLFYPMVYLNGSL